MELVEQINYLKRKKNAIILAHFYQSSEIQDIADFLGDSLQLSQKAAETNADIIVFAGVEFMAETAKILSPNKKVLLPVLEAGCSLADSISPDKLQVMKDENPNHIVISYINTSASIKTKTDVVCTSSNAIQIVESFPKDQEIIFTPDYNLGEYINRLTGRNMKLWKGSCHVHQQFSLEGILKLKKDNPNAKIISHPECNKSIQIISDFVGSTSAMLKYTNIDNSNTYIVATESGILHQMKILNPLKMFIPAPPLDSTCGCNDCEFMKMVTLERIYNSLLNEIHEIKLSDDIIARAVVPIRKMLEISEKAGLLKK